MRLLLCVVLAAACANPSVVTRMREAELPASMRVSVAQEPGAYSGFASTEKTEDPGLPYTLSGVHLREAEGYLAITQDFADRIGPLLTCEDYVSTLHGLLARMQQQGLATIPDGARALAMLTAVVAEERAKLAMYGDRPLARAKAVPVVLLDGKPKEIATDLGMSGTKWMLTGFGGNDAPRIPMVASTADARGTELWRVFLDPRVALGVATFFDFADRLQKATVDVEQAVLDLGDNALAWANYLQRGYGQFPWENYANSLLVSSAWDRAPSAQFVLLHPEPGVVFDVGRADSANLSPALLVHGLGYLHYFGAERSWYLGAAATGALTDNEDNGYAYGITLLSGRTTAGSTLPCVSVGLLWHDGVAADGFQVSLGVDVLQLLGHQSAGSLAAGQRRAQRTAAIALA